MKHGQTSARVEGLAEDVGVGAVESVHQLR
jgi:hypothetical protein